MRFGEIREMNEGLTIEITIPQFTGPLIEQEVEKMNRLERDGHTLRND